MDFPYAPEAESHPLRHLVLPKLVILRNPCKPRRRCSPEFGYTAGTQTRLGRAYVEDRRSVACQFVYTARRKLLLTASSTEGKLAATLQQESYEKAQLERNAANKGCDISQTYAASENLFTPRIFLLATLGLDHCLLFSLRRLRFDVDSCTAILVRCPDDFSRLSKPLCKS